MGKYKIPTVQQFLEKKTIYGPKKDPVWVFLEREMLANISKKPYNNKVGNWLKYLKDLKYYFYCEGKRKERRLNVEVGPAWYFELSSKQREVLNDLKGNIHQDLLEDLPIRMRQSLSDLGITLKFPKPLLMQAMNDCVNDPGVFIWNLYTAHYKKPPSELRSRYDINAMILMSSLVFIDLEECIERLEKLTYFKKTPMPEPPKKKNKYYQPDIRYGEYKQKMYVPFYSTHGSGQPKKPKCTPLGYKFRLRSDESYERLCNDHSFLAKRKERNKKAKQSERVCNYKFWEPPSTLRNTDPNMVAYVNKLKMLKKKAKPKHKAPYNNIQYLVTGISFTGETPRYILTNVALLPTGYIPINGGIVACDGVYITQLLGYWKFPREVKIKCQDTCDCLTKWENTVMDYLKESKCKCGHLYDYYHEGKAKEKYFYPPTKHGKFWVDKAKIFQMDPTEDFIKDTLREALLSGEPTPEPSMPTISASGLKEKELLAALLADLSDTPLLIPHLPQANLLNNLQEWVRKRVKGKILPEHHRKLILQSQRRWLDLKHMDFRARAYRIPFTLKQLEHFNWSHRNLVQNLFYEMAIQRFMPSKSADLSSPSPTKKLVAPRHLNWSLPHFSTKNILRDIYFTYMPGRAKDTFLINPYSSERTPKHGAKTCPL